MEDTYLDKSDLAAILPHGIEFVFIDLVKSFCPVKQALVSEFFVNTEDKRIKGHFADRIIFPAIFQIEAMAQSSGVLLHLLERDTFGGTEQTLQGYLIQNKISFKRIVYPGSKIEIHTSIKQRFGNNTEFNVICNVDGHRVSHGTLQIAVQK
ncbi:3-hydroxyacyl-ACP dehydratase FabZ family protein [Teredinibacter waterburyi]|uniref:3-hydroxyacyl-ACP dehydratase FabZ family protein n=1 Tax=Teredinibacter waterburyi TaxID=1500538 RepID=UPI00165FC6C9|nr:hypothetical protein [Teredinibacter waterburyi]